MDERCYVTHTPGLGYYTQEWDPAYYLNHEDGERLIAAGSMEACEAAIRLMRQPDVEFEHRDGVRYVAGRVYAYEEATHSYGSPAMTLCKGPDGNHYSTRGVLDDLTGQPL